MRKEGRNHFNRSNGREVRDVWEHCWAEKSRERAQLPKDVKKIPTEVKKKEIIRGG